MLDKTKFYINGEWVNPVEPKTLDVIDPSTEEACAVISMGGEADVNKAVASAREAFETYSQTSKEERLQLLKNLMDIMNKNNADMGEAVRLEMGAPKTLADNSQAGSGPWHLGGFIEALEEFEDESKYRDTEKVIRHEPIGVCGLITPWNWPVNQIALKVIPAVAVGCTVVLKPSEIAPLSAMVFAEWMDQAGFPKGVFNLVNGDGPSVGSVMSKHPDIDMMSFTGSTRAGVMVTKDAADTVKRVSLELGGKSPNIIFADADLQKAVKRGVLHCMNNTGQSCNAPTRMLIEKSAYEEAVKIAEETAKSVKVGPTTEEGRHMGPVVSELQFNKIQGLIQAGIDEGARLVAGGVGRPEGFEKGYYIKPTVFADVNNEMTVAAEEIFGPVLAMIPFETEEEAIKIGNDTPYGLAAYVQTQDLDKANRVARKLRAGMVHMNGGDLSQGMPFGGYKQSGIGREGGKWGLEDFLETKAITC
ncbi:aldehyde dehydrogenase family protein [Curvivirga sp.]|uniref:aldehyde dehydrogenase family protein n=1 Tax=Curvivirga sp. TaxID=2856848 RepID=UPI003B5C5A7A